MTTPEEARELIQKHIMESPVEITLALNDLANQVERLEAQRKELREALEEAFDLSNDPKIYNKIYAALKATE